MPQYSTTQISKVWNDEQVLGPLLARSDVIGTPFAVEVFALVDALHACDARFRDFIERTRG